MTKFYIIWQYWKISYNLSKNLTTFNKNGYYSTELKDNWQYWTNLDNICQILDIFGQYRTIFVNICQYLLIYNNITAYLAIQSRLCCFETFWILYIYITRTSSRGALAPKNNWQYWTKSDNICQYWIYKDNIRQYLSISVNIY